jgi:hypothetical protein
MPGVVLVRPLDVSAPQLGGVKGWLVATLASALLIAPYSLVAEPQEPTSVAPLDRMTAEDRVATGVERLTSAELAALNRWLAQQLGTSADLNLVTAPVITSDPIPGEVELADSMTASEAAGSATEQNAAIEAEVARRVARELAAARADDQAVEISEPLSLTT